MREQLARFSLVKSDTSEASNYFSVKQLEPLYWNGSLKQDQHTSLPTYHLYCTLLPPLLNVI